MNDHSVQQNNCQFWAEFWENATRPSKGRGPMQAGFWNSMAGRYDRSVSQEEDEQRVSSTIRLIEGTGLDLSGAEVLDIGAGTGSLAIPLAKRGARVTVLDFSTEMLKQLTERAEKEGVSITHILPKSWDDIDLDAEQLRGRFDLVIASMTPAVRCPVTFQRMLETSKGICFYCGWVSRQWDTAYYELYRLLFNEDFREGVHGFYLPFMYLYMQGYQPAVEITRNEWRSEETIDEMVESVSGFFSVTKDVDETMKSRIREYVQTHAINGRYYSKTIATTAMMVWDMKNTTQYLS